MDIQIVEERINTLKSQKADLLRLKKKQRGNNVKDIESRIARLKQWKTDLKTIKETKNNDKFAKKTCKTIVIRSKSINALTSKSDHEVDALKMFGSLTSVFQQVRSEEIQKTIKKR